MSARRLAILLLIDSIVLIPNRGVSQTPSTHTYIISISGSKYYSKPIIQTGFRLSGIPGIITALHGVVHGTELSALNEYGGFDRLRISKVDIERDVALLDSDAPDLSGFDGLTPADTHGLNPHDTLNVWGFPYGIQLHDKSVNAGNPVVRSLRSLIGADAAISFATRKSPSIDVTVIDIEGQLGPGHSGAPVIDGHQKVIGVVDGGLAALGINWAIPISEIRWTDAASRKAQLDGLANSDPRDLFDYQSQIVQPVRYGNIAIRFLAGERDLRGLGVHLSAERPFILGNTRFAAGIEGAYLGHDAVAEFSTLAGYPVTQIHEYLWTPAVSGLIRWLPWESISLDPSLAVLGGYPFNLQLSVTANIFYFAPLQIKFEVRGGYFTSHKKVVEFNPFGDSYTSTDDQKIFRVVIGVAVAFGV
jgi:hypothetical protein